MVAMVDERHEKGDRWLTFSKLLERSVDKIRYLLERH